MLNPRDPRLRTHGFICSEANGAAVARPEKRAPVAQPSRSWANPQAGQGTRAQGQPGCSGHMMAIAWPWQTPFSEPLISFDFQQDGGPRPSFFSPSGKLHGVKNQQAGQEPGTSHSRRPERSTEHGRELFPWSANASKASRFRKALPGEENLAHSRRHSRSPRHECIRAMQAALPGHGRAHQAACKSRVCSPSSKKILNNCNKSHSLSLPKR